MTSFPPPEGGADSPAQDNSYAGPPSLQKQPAPPPYNEPSYTPPAPPTYGQPYGGQPAYEPPAYGQGYGQPAYGQQPPPYGPPAYPAQPGFGGAYPSTYAATPGQNGLGIAGMICGITGLVLFWIPFVGGLVSLVGAVLSGIAIPNARSKRQGIGMAVAGLICGILGVIVGILWIVAIFVSWNDPYYY